MKKLESSLKNMLLVLTLVSVVAAFLLAFVSYITKETIESEKGKKEAKATKKVLNIDELQDIIIKSDTIKSEKREYIISSISNIDSCFIGSAVKSVETGFGGNIEVLVGFDTEGNILGYELLDGHSETPGLGARAKDWFSTATSSEVKEVDPLSKIFFGNPDPAGSHNIIGRNIGSEGELKVSKDGGDIDAITASTITSRAFLNAVNNAYKVYKGNVSDVNSSATAQE